MKIRLVGGPLSGKVMNINDHRDSVIVVGQKKMSRKALSDWMFDQSGYTYMSSVQPNRMYRPTVTAEYRKVRLTISEFTGMNGIVFTDIPSVHPDGSYFYKYVRTNRDDTKP